EQREQWMHPLLEGKLRSCFSMTEASGGSDPTRIETRAGRDGDEWVINGTKWFSSNASIADIIIVMCRTNDSDEVHRRFSMIVVPGGTPGVRIRDVPNMQHPYERPPAYSGEGDVTYENVRVPYENILGGEGEA